MDFSMKVMQAASWCFLAVETAFVIFLLIERNAGDDAAGRGVATGFGMLFLPVILLAGGLLVWGQRSGSRGLRIVAFGITAIPFVIGAGLAISSSLEERNWRKQAARAGQFSDKRLTLIAGAIDRKDYQKERELLAAGKVDWTARDLTDATLLGHAVKRLRDDYDAHAPVEGVTLLLAAGAPLLDSATRADEHLMETVFRGNSTGALELFKILLDAGGDANAKDKSGLPLIHTLECTVPKLKLLAEHGADLNALNNRADRPKWTPLMNAVYMKQWDQALFLLEKGAPVLYQAPDGNTAAVLLSERAKQYDASLQSEPGYEEVARAISAASK